MDKKKTSLIAVISIGLVIVLGICFLKFGEQDRQDKRDETQSVATTEASTEPTTEAVIEPTVEASMVPAMEPEEENQETGEIQEQQAESESQTEGEQQEERLVLIVEEKEVRDNPTFAAFIDKEITAYDKQVEKNRYLFEYFIDFTGVINGIHYMAEDLNQDTKNELLVYIETTWGFGDLLVFEETESGELIAWEIWEDILRDRQPYIYYCGNGTFMMHGGLGISVGHYTQEGNHELLMDYYHTIEESNDTYYMVSIWLKLYENGEVVKKMEYERYCDIETGEDIIELESDEAREGEKLADEILNALIQEKEVSIGGAEYINENKDKVKIILLDELQSPKEVKDYPSEEEIAALGIREDMLAYWMVLNSKKPFVSANEGGQEFYWDQYFWCLSEPDPMFTIYDFSTVDLDNDGVEEMVLVGLPDTTQVLDYQDGKVYSYQFPFRGMAGIALNGVYSGSSAADIGGFYRIHLDKGVYEEETLAYMYGDYFEVEGLEVSADDFFAYIDPLAKAEQIERMDFTEEMLDKILLGDLEEEELFIVKHMKPETEDDNILQVAEIPIVYLRVLTGREEFVCAAEEGEKYIVDGDSIKDPQGKAAFQILYFSVLDMEGDGEAELVLTCDGITLILHAAEGVIYGYIFDFWDEMGAIAGDGVFRMGYVNGNKCGKIVSFETDGCQIEPVKDYASDSRDRIRYYFFSKETVARWWNFVF
ncbi:MAG: hypothetical protein K2K63_01270 [Acetatifactor sp.]|nr:hypothetical protein [Acetatifactor sp.]